MATYISPEGLEKLKKELEDRKTITREEINAKIKEAKQFGDLSENSEYTEAREAQGFNEGRIEDLEQMIRDAVIVSGSQKHGAIDVGSTIKVTSVHGEQKFTIVGVAEADPVNGFISNESPLAEAFIGRKKGEEVEVKVPSGKIKYKINDIE
ncbi:MAG: transcription elongation factor GreA [bacterium]|nr:transcription elongation factor GreA [bacterium]